MLSTSLERYQSIIARDRLFLRMEEQDFRISASNTTGASFGQVTSGSMPTSPSSLVLVTPSASFSFGRVVFGSLQWCMVKANVYRKKEWTEEDLPYQSFIPYQPPQYIYHSMPINNNQPSLYHNPSLLVIYPPIVSTLILIIKYHTTCKYSTYQNDQTLHHLCGVAPLGS
jgi:hypothetical protein